jgi:hypothetical protein
MDPSASLLTRCPRLATREFQVLLQGHLGELAILQQNSYYFKVLEEPGTTLFLKKMLS